MDARNVKCQLTWVLPSVGLSVDIKGHFSTMFGDCGSLSASNHEQGLGRVREPIDRVVYCPDRIMAQRPKGFSVKGILQCHL